MLRNSRFRHACVQAANVTAKRSILGAVVAAVALGGAGLAEMAPAAATTPTTVTLFGTATPKVAADPDTGPVELGVRFSSDVAGSITGVRFYKGPRNTGRHTGSLWTASGSRLATATFTSETSTGWQKVTFARPVPVAANTTYLASYYAPRGHYAADNGYFNSRHDSGPLHAPATLNGVYTYGSGGGFPKLTYQATNYYVDVAFLASTTPAPVPTATATTAPTTSPTAAPTVAPTTPAPAPTATTSAPAANIYGWQLTGSNTGLAGVGIDRNSLPTFTGTITAGMTISNVKITTPLDLGNTPNVTLDRVWLAPVGGTRAVWLGPDTVIKDSDITGSSMGTGERIAIAGDGTGNYTLARLNITKVSIGAWLDGTGPGVGTMTDSYIHDQESINGSHVDGLTRRGGTGVLNISRCRVDTNSSNVTGAFFLQNTWGAQIAGITVKDTYLSGNGYVLTLENKGAGTSVALDNVRVQSNSINGVGYGPVTTTGTINFPVWNVTTYDGNNLPTASGGGAGGVAGVALDDVHRDASLYRPGDHRVAQVAQSPVETQFAGGALPDRPVKPVVVHRRRVAGATFQEAVFQPRRGCFAPTLACPPEAVLAVGTRTERAAAAVAVGVLLAVLPGAPGRIDEPSDRELLRQRVDLTRHLVLDPQDAVVE